MPYARVAAVSVGLPERTVTNSDLSAEFPEWSVEKITAKTGIASRRIASENEFSSTLAARAAEALFRDHSVAREAIDYVLLCTQTPDFLLPGTASIVHGMLGLRADAGAIDVSQGCSGYIYALGLAKGLIETGQARNILVITTDTYSKLLNPADRSVRTIFGDGATASLVDSDGSARSLEGFVYGSDGSGGPHLVTPGGGLRHDDFAPKSDPSARGLQPSAYDLFMDGPEIFNFALKVVPSTIDRVLAAGDTSFGDIDLWVFHQANAYMLQHLRKKLGVDPEKFVISLEGTGNTVSSTIPIALADLESSGRLTRGSRVLLLGFGVGLSWAGNLMTW